MPHLVIQYTSQLDTETDMTALCRALADTLLAVRDEAGQPAFPIGGTRVLAYPAAHHAVATGERERERAFLYFNLRIARGRSPALRQRTGDALLAAARAHLAAVLERRPLGLTLQIDEGPEVYDGKAGNLHALFRPS